MKIQKLLALFIKSWSFCQIAKLKNVLGKPYSHLAYEIFVTSLS